MTHFEKRWAVQGSLTNGCFWVSIAGMMQHPANQ